MTDELRRTWGAGTLVDTPIGVHYFGPESVNSILRNVYGPNTLELLETSLRRMGGLMLADAFGNREELRSRIAPEMRRVVDELEPDQRIVTSFDLWGADLRGDVRLPCMALKRFSGFEGGNVVDTLS